MNTLMKITLPLSLAMAAMLPQVAAADDAVQMSSAVNATEYKGKMLYGPAGERLAAVYRVSPDGAAHIILNGQLVGVPASTLTAANGKLSTSLSKREILTSH